MDHKQIAQDRTILKAPMGSTLYGINLEDSGDRDEMGVCIEPMNGVAGFHEFDQYIYRSATERTGKHDAPSEVGDLDLTIYGLRKFLRLAMHGNPTVVQMLFVRPEDCLVRTKDGEDLQSLSNLIVSRQAGKRFLGYMEAQRQRLLGERGQKKCNRPELEEKYGFDTKYGAHIIRLGIQGNELLETGSIPLPMTEPNRVYLKALRRGEIPLQDVLTRAGELETSLKDLLTSSPLQEKPDEYQVENWMLSRYRCNWT